MRTIAQIAEGVIVSTVLWDGTSAIDLTERGAYTTADVTDLSPQPGVGWADSGGTFTAPLTAAGPDPIGFMRSVIYSGSLTTATKVSLPPWLGVLADAIAAGDSASIAMEWANLCAGVPIPSDDQAAVHALAVTYGIPGI